MTRWSLFLQTLSLLHPLPGTLLPSGRPHASTGGPWTTDAAFLFVSEPSPGLPGPFHVIGDKAARRNLAVITAGDDTQSGGTALYNDAVNSRLRQPKCFGNSGRSSPGPGWSGGWKYFRWLGRPGADTIPPSWERFPGTLAASLELW